MNKLITVTYTKHDGVWASTEDFLSWTRDQTPVADTNAFLATVTDFPAEIHEEVSLLEGGAVVQMEVVFSERAFQMYAGLYSLASDDGFEIREKTGADQELQGPTDLTDDEMYDNFPVLRPDPAPAPTPEEVAEAQAEIQAEEELRIIEDAAREAAEIEAVRLADLAEEEAREAALR